jgi:pilus assembly protein CpaF
VAWLVGPVMQGILIWIIEPGRVFVARHGRSEPTTTILTEGQVRDLVEKMLKSSGCRIDLSSPFVDACGTP